MPLTTRRLAAPSLVLLVVALLAPAPLAADVHVVDKAGGGDFLLIQDAIDAAAEGDIIVIRPGNYANPTETVFIDGKGLVLIGDTGGSTLVGFVNITNIGASSTVVIRNVELVPNPVTVLNGATLRISNSQGLVFVEDCSGSGLAGGPGFMGSTATDGLPAVIISNSSATTLQRCTLSGGHGIDTDNGFPPFGQQVPSNGADAVQITSSSVAIYDCVLDGGDGGNDLIFDEGGLNGGAGVLATDGSLVVSGSAITGGDGGDGCSRSQPGRCLGGDGVAMVGASNLQALDSPRAGGSGGALDEGGNAPDGADVSGGFTLEHPGNARSLVRTAPVRTGETAMISYDGEPGDTIGIFFGFTGLYLPLLGKRGVFLPGLPLLGPVVVGPLPTGDVDIPVVVGDRMDLGVEGYIHIDQAFVQGTDGLLLSSASCYVQIDDNF